MNLIYAFFTFLLLQNGEASINSILVNEVLKVKELKQAYASQPRFQATKHQSLLLIVEDTEAFDHNIVLNKQRVQIIGEATAVRLKISHYLRLIEMNKTDNDIKLVVESRNARLMEENKALLVTAFMNSTTQQIKRYTAVKIDL